MVATRIFFVFTPNLGEDDYQFDEHIFQRGWFNHQPVHFLGHKIVHFHGCVFGNLPHLPSQWTSGRFANAPRQDLSSTCEPGNSAFSTNGWPLGKKREFFLVVRWLEPMMEMKFMYKYCEKVVFTWLFVNKFGRKKIKYLRLFQKKKINICS